MANEWNMPRPASHCAVCAREFAVGETFQALVIAEEGNFVRRDVCLGCPPPALLPPLGSWRVRRQAPQQRPAPAVDREALYLFFTRLDADDPQREQFRFVLALLLWRKKVLALQDTLERDDGEVWRFTAGKDKQVHDVRRPELDEAEVERLSRQLEDLLASGLPQGALDEARGEGERIHA